ncbi:MAG: DUF6089 family protein [Bacteroidetes bacterium]|nr:DUF6089 family protein [Bacteroidota bacterium]
MKKIFTFLLLLLIILPSLVNAQRWKRQRYEFSIGAGVTNFLGELGGANQIGTHYFRDLEFSQTRLAAALGLRYKLSNYFAVNTHLTYGRVSGDDKLTTEKFRHTRNINFFSDIYEWSLNFEGAFQQEQIGHRYRLKKVRGLKGYELYTYLFAGVGVFYFNPKAEFQGQTYNLRDYNTEGQGYVPTRKKYSTIQLCIPLGIGFKYTIDRQWGVGLEFGIRKTFTDYIDDVSTTYIDLSQYQSGEQYDVGQFLANPSDRSDAEAGRITAAGQQRGDPRYKDSYMFAVFSVNYKIKTGRNNLPRF